MARTVQYGRLAAARPSVTTELELYVVPANTEINGILRVCNHDGQDRTYGVAHTATAGAAQAADWIPPAGKMIEPHDLHEISIHAKAGETIRVIAGTADLVSFHLSGQKITT